MAEKPTYEKLKQKVKELDKETLKIRCSTVIPLYQRFPVNLGLSCFLVFTFPAFLWSVERCIENSCHANCPLPISIFVVVIALALFQRHLPHCIRVPLLSGIVLALVLVGFINQIAAEGRGPERIVVAGGDSFEPLIFLNADGEPDGMYVDRWRLWSEKVGVEVDLRLMDWANAIPALIAGEVDAVDGVTYTPERAKVIDLSASYTELPSYIYFHESIGGVRGLVDLEGFPVGVIGGSHVEDYLHTEAPKLRPVPYANYEEVVQAAIQGRLRVFIGEDPMIPFLFAKMGHRITFRRTEKPIISSDMRTAVRKGETELLSLIERGHKAITPTEWQRIRDEWAGVSLTSRIPWRWLIGGVAILLIGIALLLLWNTQLQKRVATATRTLSESEERLRSFGNALPDLAFILDQDGRYLEILTAEEHLLYKDLSDLKNHQLHEVLPKDVADLSLEVIEKTIETGKMQVFEYKLDLPTGQRWFEARVSPMLGISSDNRMVTCISRDISERKKAEEELRESEERFRVLFESAPDPFYINKMDGTIVDGNKAAEEFMGYKKEELIGTNFLKIGLLPDENLPKALKLLEQNQKGKPTGPDEFMLYRKNGEPAYAEISTHPVNIGGENLVLGIARDIGERKKAEEETRKLEAQLRQAQKMEAIGTLAGGIAHDFNNILSAIIGFTGLSIRDVPPGSKLEDNLQRVLNAGIRAGDLVKQILTFSRQTDREIKPVQVKPIAQEALKLIRASLPATIEIHQDIRSDSPIMADPTQVHQIIMNLCTNAAHVMQDTGGRIVVSLTDVELGADVSDPHPDMAPGPFIKLTVSDSGRGIAPEIKDRIFNPFFTTKELGEGTGLGLSVVHGIVKDCGGMVTAQSTPGKGSTFNVFFPVIESRHGTEIVTRAPLPTGTERILFVDDEEYQVEMGKQVLELLGYRVMTETSSPEALRMFRAKPDEFDLVVTDMIMPNMTGDVLAKEIMTIRSDVPIILCTGYSEKITPAKAKALGIKEVVLKPAVVEEIARTVRRVLDQTFED